MPITESTAIPKSSTSFNRNGADDDIICLIFRRFKKIFLIFSFFFLDMNSELMVNLYHELK